MLTWRLVQDHVKKDMLFAATEFGIYFTYDGGTNWMQLKGGLPTIAFRDITIQRRENDLVGASFGRGFYILDDITPLREFNPSKAKTDVVLFPVKKALWYVPKRGAGSQGDSEYAAKNPPYGAIFNYYLPDSIASLAGMRKIREKKDPGFPGWDALEEERRQEGPDVVLLVKNDAGETVRIVKGSNRKGFNSANWKLTYPSMSGELLEQRQSRWGSNGFMVTPGTYSVSLAKRENGVITELAPAQNFEVVALHDGALPRASFDEIDAFREKYVDFKQDLTATEKVLETDMKMVAAMKSALSKAKSPSAELARRIEQTRIDLLDLDKKLSGSKVKAEIGEAGDPVPDTGDGVARSALRNSTYGPTGTHKAALNLSIEQLESIKTELKKIDETTIPALKKELEQAGAPWIQGKGF